MPTIREEMRDMASEYGDYHHPDCRENDDNYPEPCTCAMSDLIDGVATLIANRLARLARKYGNSEDGTGYQYIAMSDLQELIDELRGGKE